MMFGTEVFSVLWWYSPLAAHIFSIAAAAWLVNSASFSTCFMYGVCVCVWVCFVCVCVFVHVCMYVCMYVCTYVCMHTKK